MSNKKNIIQLCENYLQKHKVNMSVEGLFIHFKEIENMNKEFNQYLQKKNFNYILEKIRRNERLKTIVRINYK